MSNLPNDVYGRMVSMVSDGVNDTYSVGKTFNMAFPTGTPQNVVYLTIAIEGKLEFFQDAIKDFVQQAYDLETRVSLLALYVMAQRNSLTNRANYIASALMWADSVVAYSLQFAATISQMTDPNVIASTDWDLSAIDASNPRVTTVAAVQIGN